MVYSGLSIGCFCYFESFFREDCSEKKTQLLVVVDYQYFMAHIYPFLHYDTATQVKTCYRV